MKLFQKFGIFYWIIKEKSISYNTHAHICEQEIAAIDSVMSDFCPRKDKN